MKLRQSSLAGPATALLVLLLAACSEESVEERAREAAERMKDALGPDLEAVAIAQKIDPEVVKEVQQNLTAIHEYQGEITDKLDGVTVNAIQAFQRSAGLNDDGIVNPRTRERLKEAAAKARQAPAPQPAGAT